MADNMDSLPFHKLMVFKSYSTISIEKAGFTAATIFSCKSIFFFSSLLLSIFAVICGYGGFSNAVAQEASFQAQTADNLNAVLLMDSSASMLVNDPDKLRDQGARLLLQFLKPGDKLAIVRFDETAQIIRPLSPFVSDQLPALQTSLNSIEASGQYTDLNAGLQAAQTILSKLSSSEGKSVIILLSDGKMDPAPSRGTIETHLDELTTRILPSIKNSGQKVYTLAFSQDADKPLLQHIAQATDGINWFTPNSDTIHESFADLFLSLKKPQVVPYGPKGFKIDPNVEEATFYINQPEEAKIEIEDPDEERFSAAEPGDEIRWFDGKKFSVITIMRPQAGEWKLLGVNPDNGFATILTNLKLVTDWPNAIPLDEPILLRARLYEGKIPVDLEEIAQAVNFAFQITPSDRVSEPVMREFLGDDGKNGDEKAGDGIFSYNIKLADAGEYRLRIVARGPTFERQLQIPFRVRPPLMTFAIEEPLIRMAETDPEVEGKDSGDKAASHGAEEGGDSHAESAVVNKHVEGKPLSAESGIISGSEKSILQVVLNEEASTLKDISVVIGAVDKERNKYSLPARLTKNVHAGDEVSYQASAQALPKDGLFELKAYLKAQTRDGKRIDEESSVIKFSRKTVVALADIPVVEPTVREEAPVKEQKPINDGFEWLALVVVIVVNLLLAAGLYVLLLKKKAQAGDNTSFELPGISNDLVARIDDLEKRVQIETVNMEDDKFLGAETGSSSDTSMESSGASDAQDSAGASSDNASG